MQECEQLFYTTATIGNKSGYQVTARTIGITEEIIQEMEGYLYPTGMDSNKFTTSNSLLFLKNKKIAFSTVRNVGTGFDGRDNTLYNHTIILEREQFEKVECDSRNLQKYYVEDIKKQGKLDKITIQDNLAPINWEFFQKIPRNILETVLEAIFFNKKIILSGIKEKEFIPEIISILPKSMRMLSYSNMVVEPNRQNRYDIMQVGDDEKLSADLKNWINITVDKIPMFYENDSDFILERTIKILVQILKNKEKYALEFIHNEFESIESTDIKNKIKLATYYRETKNDENIERVKKFANDMPEILNKFNDEKITIKYILEIKKFLPERDYEKYSKEIEFSHIMSKFKEKKINYENINQMFRSFHERNYESWDKLFKQIIKNNIEKIKESGVRLLIDARYNYEEVIMDNFLKNEELNECISEMFDESAEWASYYKKSYFEHIIEKVAKNNTNLSIILLKKPVFNLKDEYDSRHYKNILKSILKNNEFLDKTELNSILELIKNVFTRIKEVVEYKPSSGIAGTTDSNLHELIKIIKRFQKTLEYFEKKKLDSKLHDKIISQKEEISVFLEKHKTKRTISSLWD